MSQNMCNLGWTKQNLSVVGCPVKSTGIHLENVTSSYEAREFEENTLTDNLNQGLMKLDGHNHIPLP